MADDIKNAPVQETESSDDIAASRRQFTKAGIAGGVMMTLLSRPSLGHYYDGHAGDKQCSPSLLASYNLSAHPELEQCKYGCSPGYWKTANSSPEHHSVCEWDSGVPPEYARQVLFAQAFNLPSSQHKSTDPFSHGLYTLTLEEVVNGMLPSGYTAIGLHAVAALLNSVHDVISTAWVADPATVINDFQTAYASWYMTGSKVMLKAFKNKYDIYSNENVVCVLPTARCKI